jgi:hypothetical protein
MQNNKRQLDIDADTMMSTSEIYSLEQESRTSYNDYPSLAFEYYQQPFNDVFLLMTKMIISIDFNFRYMYDLVANSPTDDKDYILYRFDNQMIYFLQKFVIGDIYVENGFLSTTRDPFYNTKKYNFGDILMKIHIPKNKKGCGLCIETLSMFPNEEENINDT